jgi:hypothetical protein
MTGSGPIIPAGIRDVVRLHSGLSIRTVPQSNVMLYLNTLILQLPYVLRMHSVETSAAGISLKELTSVLLDPEGEMILKAEKNIAFAINVTR